MVFVPLALICIFWLNPHLQDKYLDEINKAMLEKIKRLKKEGDTSNATVNRVLALVRSILNCACKEWEWLDSAPSIRLLPEPQKSLRWLSQDEAATLLKELPAHLEAMARFTLEPAYGNPTSPACNGHSSTCSAVVPGSTQIRQRVKKPLLFLSDKTPWL